MSDTIEETSNYLTAGQTIESIALPIMIAIGTVCNILTFIVMCRHRFRHQSTGFYMAILAIADELVLLIGGIIRWIFQFYQKNPLSTQFSCKCLSVAYYSSIDFSVWMVVMMTLERYIAVTFPLQANRLCTVKRAKILTILLGVCVISINSHFLLTHSYNNNFNNQDFGCQSTSNATRYFMDNIWPWIDAAKYSFVPLLTIILINFLIIFNLIRASTTRNKLTQTGNLRLQSRSSSGAMNQTCMKQANGTSNVSSNNRRLTTMLLVVSITFCILSTPLVILQILENHFSIRSDTKEISKAIFVILQYSNHCINFFLYAFTGEIFRRELYAILAIMRRLIDKNYQPAATASKSQYKSIRDRTNNVTMNDYNPRNHISKQNSSEKMFASKEVSKDDLPSNEAFVQSDKINKLGKWRDSDDAVTHTKRNHLCSLNNLNKLVSIETKL